MEEWRQFKRRKAYEQRFWADVLEGQPDECWPWHGGFFEKTNYGRTGLGRKLGVASILTHRIAYELAHGPIPAGHEVHHACHDRDPDCKGGPSCPHRRCCNPAHLEPLLADDHRKRHYPEKTHCPQGHPYNGDRLVVHGRRRCLTCQEERARVHSHCSCGQELVDIYGEKRCPACRARQAAEATRRRMADPEYAAKMRAYKREYAARKRAEDPAYAERARAAAREYQRRKREAV